MGAIAVFLAGSARPPIGVVEAMAAAVPHRGSRVETLAVGRCALATTEGDADGDAGLAVDDGVAAAFAGTLDNAADLAGDLAARGVLPVSRSPAALIAAAHRIYGDTLPGRLRGVFAGAVTDGERVYSFRDHLGYGLLFYRRDGGDFYAATEAKQVVAGAGIPKEPDVDVVERIFFGTYDDETPCALRGVRRLPKAHAILADSHGAQIKPYWDPESVLETARLSDGELEERFSALMDQAVSRCLTGQDVISLSGGIDSPAVAAFAAPRHLELSGRPLQALSAVYPKYPSVDERPYIELLAAHFDIPLHTFEQQANALDDLDRWVMLADGPYPAASLAHYAEDYALARGLGARTVLTGEHAEFVVALNWYLLDHLITRGRLRAAHRHLRHRRDRGARRRTLAREVAVAVAPGRLRAERERRRRVGLPDWIDGPKASEAAAERIASARGRWRHLQLSAFGGPGLSSEAEAICQAVSGVRTRRPWADVDLFEFFLSLPAEQKFPDGRGKELVRRLLRGRVPDQVLDRRDHTVFDEAMLAEIDFPTLRRFLIDPAHRFDGIDYDTLGDRLRREDFGLWDYAWARQLVVAHAFLAQW